MAQSEGPRERILVPVTKAVGLLLWRLLWYSAWLFMCVLRQGLTLAYQSLLSAVQAAVQAKRNDCQTLLDDGGAESAGSPTPAAVRKEAAAAQKQRRRSNTSEEVDVERKASEASLHDIATIGAGAEEGAGESSFELRLLGVDGRASGVTREELDAAVEKARGAPSEGLRFSVQAEDPHSFNLAIFGLAAAAERASSALQRMLPVAVEESVAAFFALHFTLREAWDLPEDDELLDAALCEDWVDLGGGGAGEVAQQPPEGEEAADSRIQVGDLRSVLHRRLEDMVPHQKGLQLFVDRNPYASWGQDRVRVDILGPLTAEAWEAATQLVLACEGHSVYLSRRYDAIFWPGAELRPHIEKQVACAMSHWKGTPNALSGSETLGISTTLLPGFEDLAANIKAILNHSPPPGWHRLEWTPNCAGAVPHLTY